MNDLSQNWQRENFGKFTVAQMFTVEHFSISVLKSLLIDGFMSQILPGHYCSSTIFVPEID